MYSIGSSFRQDMPDSLKWQTPPTSALPFDLADMDLATMPEVISALTQRAREGQFGYASPPPALMQTVIERVARLYNWEISSDSLIWLPGTVSGLRAAILALCPDKAHNVMTFVPAYEPFLSLPKALKRTLITVPLAEHDNWRINFEAFEKTITPQTKLLLLCHPHNPTGAMWPAADILKLIAICKRHNIVICSDEVHAELILDTSKRHTPTATADPSAPIITLMSASKTFNLAGLGCGFAVITDPVLRDKFATVRSQYIPAVTTFGYAGTQAAFTHGDIWKEQLLELLRDNQRQITLFCQEHNLTMYQAPATYLAWIDITSVKGWADLKQRCAQHGIKIYTGESFGYPGFMRLTFACSPEQLKHGLSRLHTALISSG